VQYHYAMWAYFFLILTLHTPEGTLCDVGN
jgi:hypothetical protein